MPARLPLGVIGAVAIFGLVLQIGLNLSRDAALGVSPGQTIYALLAYFTIWTNILIGVLGVWRLTSGRGPGPSLMAATTLYIAVVALVYHLVLRPDVPPAGWRYVTDMIFHTLVPVAFVLNWLVLERTGTLSWRAPIGWLIFPAVFFAVALVRGAIGGNYPYFFIDVAEIGAGATIRNALILLALFWALGLGLVGLDRGVGARARA